MSDRKPRTPSLLEAVAEACSDFGWTDRSVVVAVSGGADSTALLHLLSTLAQNRPAQLIVAHFDHRLRATSGDEARFVFDLAARLSLPFELGQADVASLADEQGDGIEAAARHARYRFLEKVADQHRAHFVATGHTANDQAETLIHRILRGTGVAGLQGIHSVRPLFGRQDIYLVRPFLDLRRTEIEEFLRTIEQPYCEDSSNLDPRFTRNRIRHQLLPLLERDFNGNVVEALLRLSETAVGAQSVVDELVVDLVDEAVTFDDDRQAVVVTCDTLEEINPHLVRELFVHIWRDMGWSQQRMGWEEWSELAAEAGGWYDDAVETIAPQHADVPYKRMYPGRILVERNAGKLTLIQLR